MILNSKKFKKQITAKVEKNVFVFFIPELFNTEEIKTILSFSIPGYPPHLNIDWFENQKINNLVEKKDLADILIIISLDTLIGFSENLIMSPKFENKIFKRIKTINGFMYLNAKTDSAIFSNPYSLFSFEYYMEENFKKMKNKTLNSQITKPVLPNRYLQTIINFCSKWILNSFFSISKISFRNSTKILCALIFFEILNIKKSISILEVFLKLVFKICALRVVETFINFKILFSAIKERTHGSFEKKTRVEIEVSGIKTLINGLVRSGNLFAI